MLDMTPCVIHVWEKIEIDNKNFKNTAKIGNRRHYKKTKM